MSTTTAEPGWDDLRVLLHVSRAGSFQAAARALRVSTSTVARRVEALEETLGKQLVLRGASGACLTQEAEALVETASQMERALAATLRDAHAPDQLTGVVRVSLGEGFAPGAVQVFAALREAHPLLRFELVVEHRLCDLARREADVGLRTTRSESQVLVERRIGQLSLSLFASQGYIARRLPTARLADAELAQHDIICHDASLGALPQARWLTERGVTAFTFRSTSDLMLVEALRAGQGIGLVADALAAQHPELVRIQAGSATPRVAIYGVHHVALRKDARIRAVIDAFEAALAAHGLANAGD
jgi:molybdate transport repressor ModE-like protein